MDKVLNFEAAQLSRTSEFKAFAALAITTQKLHRAVMDGAPRVEIRAALQVVSAALGD